ncbi:hypothetical protein DFQ27_000721 [Actinomortierella ambigua]|uniref:Uncharacterized protein n=1 Tax=Actinomortierella ambigua TaxID=1343610 RepID=A0A9P6UCZ4_9FUNG|nr:hypothetical protein DFQ26_008139 [Actinomortierella ambigua]KAG0270064.1 hypothetical protein DFQ27_000721 [Actinomortierella ambigua]
MSLINRPNPVPRLQRMYQTPSASPIYLRRGGDKVIMAGFTAILTVGLIGSLWGTQKMARGIKN